MLIKLTNAAKEYKDQQLLLNPRHIVSVFPVSNENNEEITIIYGVLQNSWSVKETVDEVYNLVNK